MKDDCLENRYTGKNRRKVSLKAHVIFVTKYRKKLLSGRTGNAVKEKIEDICSRNKYGLIRMETDKDHIHLLIGYDSTESISRIVKKLKQETTNYVWRCFPEQLKKHYWRKKVFWSDGYFACSVGEVSEETVKRYIENQG